MHVPEDPRPYAQVLTDYAQLEAGLGDTWNPLRCDVELRHRTELLRQLTWALREVSVDPTELRVLDVGCGNGRSTRMYLDLGLRPDQLTGIDLRAGAIARATATHPTIEFRQHDGGALPFEAAAFDWVSLCTVLSSVRAPAERRRLGDDIRRVLRPAGHLFFWDLRQANDFAGGDALRTGEIFPDFTPIWSRPALIRGFRGREARSLVRRGVRHVGEFFLSRPTHDGVLLRR